MIRLDVTGALRWITVAEGVRFQVRPALSADFTLARHAAAKAAQAAQGADSEAALAESGAAFTAAVARRVVVDWEGVGDAEGAPLECKPEYVELLVLRSHHAQLGFDREFVVPALTPDDEKNVSSGSPDGISTAGRRTARPAASPARTAPTKSKRLKPNKAS